MTTMTNDPITVDTLKSLSCSGRGCTRDATSMATRFSHYADRPVPVEDWNAYCNIHAGAIKREQYTSRAVCRLTEMTDDERAEFEQAAGYTVHAVVEHWLTEAADRKARAEAGRKAEAERAAKRHDERSIEMWSENDVDWFMTELWVEDSYPKHLSHSEQYALDEQGKRAEERVIVVHPSYMVPELASSWDAVTIHFETADGRPTVVKPDGSSGGTLTANKARTLASALDIAAAIVKNDDPTYRIAPFDKDAEKARIERLHEKQAALNAIEQARRERFAAEYNEPATDKHLDRPELDEALGI